MRSIISVLLVMLCLLKVSLAHWQRDEKWSRDVDQLPKVLNLTIALHHDSDNMVQLEALLKSVSDPRSPMYGQHGEKAHKAAVHHLMTPPEANRAALVSWLEDVLHIPEEDMTFSKFGDYLTLELQRSAFEGLFNSTLTRYKRYTRSNKEKRTFALREVTSFPPTMPQHIRQHVAYISGPNQLPILHDDEVQPAALVSNPTELPSSTQPNLYHELELSPEELSTLEMASQAQEAYLYYMGDGLLGIMVPLTCYNGDKAVYDGTHFSCSDGYYMHSITMVRREGGNGKKDEDVFGVADMYAVTSSNLVLLYRYCNNYVIYGFEFTVNWNSQTANSRSSRVPDPDGRLQAYPLISPDYVRSYYRLPAEYTVTEDDALQVVVSLYLNVQQQGWISYDSISYFYSYFGLPVSNIDMVSVVGDDVKNDETHPDGETMLDIEWITSMATGARSYVWHNSPWAVSSLDNVLEQIQAAVDTPDFPSVVSFSYGAREQDYVVGGYAAHMNENFMALGALGVSFLVASGDEGAFGVNADDCSSGFLPTFPASSPYVTSVGATQLVALHKDDCPYETAASADTGSAITTGGGFSNEFARPWWQDEMADEFLSSEGCAGARPTTYAYNTSGRGYPDIAVFGHNFGVVASGAVLSAVDGTSASSPTLAGMITMYNDARLRAGMPVLGFLNPLMYSAAVNKSYTKYYNDVKYGRNNCGKQGFVCCDDGFGSCAGWDPVSGLGSPEFGALGELLYPGGLPGKIEKMIVDGCETKSNDAWIIVLAACGGFFMICIPCSCFYYWCMRKGSGELPGADDDDRQAGLLGADAQGDEEDGAVSLGTMVRPPKDGEGFVPPEPLEPFKPPEPTEPYPEHLLQGPNQRMMADHERKSLTGKSSVKAPLLSGIDDSSL